MTPDDPLESRLGGLDIPTPPGLADRVRLGQAAISARRRGRAATISAALLTGILAVALVGVAARGSLGVRRAGSHPTTPGPSPAPPTGTLVGEFTPWLPLPEVAPTPPPSPPPDAPPSGVSPCRASQLQVRAGGSSALTGGQVVRGIVVRTTASTPCYLEGRPAIGVVSGGRPLSVPATAGYLPDYPVRVAVLKPGSEAFPPTTAGPEGVGVLPGWAALAYQWVACGGALGTSVVFDLPSGGGRVEVRQDPDRPSALCDSDTTARFVAVSPFLPAAPPPVISPAPVLRLSLVVQKAVHAGSTLTYFVILTNAADADVSLTPCATYHEYLGEKLAWQAYQLNCSSVPILGARASRTFEMRLVIPPGTPLGDIGLTWGSTYGPEARAAIRIER